jgi:hypothetical protein
MKLNKTEFLAAANQPKTLRDATKALPVIRAAGFVVKSQEVKAWFGNQTAASHNLTRV